MAKSQTVYITELTLNAGPYISLKQTLSGTKDVCTKRNRPLTKTPGVLVLNEKRLLNKKVKESVIFTESWR